jgi:SSS family solute:Na+ symporter
MPGNHNFGVIDWAVVLACAALLLGIGWYFARRQRTTEEYFVAGRNQRPWFAGISLFAALFSLVAYLGVPGEIVQHGPMLVIGSVAALPLTYWLISRFLIPAFMRWPITSGYELLEVRLGRSVRRTGAITFMTVRLVWMALILYVSANVVVTVTGCDPRWVPALECAIGLIATLYTLAGGIEAAMTTALLEFALLVLGAVLTVALITLRCRGVGEWWPRQAPAFWAPQPLWAADWHVRVTGVGTFLSYAISTVCAGGSDQVAIQRYLTTRDTAAARRAVLFGHMAVGSVLLILAVVGSALLGYYRMFPAQLPPGIPLSRAGDGLFPYFLSHALPPGLSGLVVAGLLTSAVSGLGPSINSVIAVANQDFLRADARSESAKLRAARWMALGIGVVIVAGSFGMASVRGNLVEVSGKTVNLFFYPIFGLFFLALFVRFATALGAVIGAIAGASAGILVGYWDVITGEPSLSFQWIGPVSLVTTLLVGITASAARRARVREA